MALIEDIIFSDPVLQRIFFDGRRFAPRSDRQFSVATVQNLESAITDAKVLFLKTKNLKTAERLQGEMRKNWFKIRRLCDGYFLTLPAGHSDGCEHVQVFAHENASLAFHIDAGKRYAIWRRYEKTTAPDAWRLRSSE